MKFTAPSPCGANLPATLAVERTIDCCNRAFERTILLLMGEVIAAFKGAERRRLDSRVGNYRLVELLGVGGMGSVYLARRVDAQFEHEVAIKILPAFGRDDPFGQRFRAERDVLARLDHPNIARLLDGGVTEEGLHYLVMEYVRGEPSTAIAIGTRLACVNGSRCSRRSAWRSTTRIAISSCIATSSPRTSW